jgi:putative transposase
MTRNLAPQFLQIHPGISPAQWINPEFCLEALEIALEGGRQPEIFHSDQGCQFTSSDFVARLQAEEIKISWSRRKRCYDNILVERLWRTVKYVVEVYSAQPSRGLSACL